MACVSDDLFLLIIVECDIDTFFTVRQTCRHVHDLIDQHLNGLVTGIAHATFPNQTRIFDPPHTTSGENAMSAMTWLTELRYRHLAAIIPEYVGGCTMHPREPISAEDALSDGLRSRLTVGWKMMHKLSTVTIEDEVVEDSVTRRPCVDQDARQDFINPKTTMSGLQIQDKEMKACRERLEALDNMSQEEVRCLDMLRQELLRNVFGFPGNATVHEGGGKWPYYSDRLIIAGVFLRIIALGPKRFWQCWKGTDMLSAERQSMMAREIEAKMTGIDDRRNLVTKHSGRCLEYQMAHIVRLREHTWREELRKPSCNEIGRQRRALTQAGETPPQPILGAYFNDMSLDWNALGVTPEPPPPSPLPYMNMGCCTGQSGFYEPRLPSPFQSTYENWAKTWSARHARED